MPKREQTITQEQREELAELSGFPGLLSAEQKLKLDSLQKLEKQNLKDIEYRALFKMASDMKDSIVLIKKEVEELQKNENSPATRKNIKENLTLSGEKERRLKVIIEELELRPEYLADKLKGLGISSSSNSESDLDKFGELPTRGESMRSIPESDGSTATQDTATSRNRRSNSESSSRGNRRPRKKSESSIKGMF